MRVYTPKVAFIFFLFIYTNCYGQSNIDSSSQIHFFRPLYFLGVGDAFILNLWTTILIDDSVMIHVKKREVQSVNLKSGYYKIRLKSNKVGRTYFLENGKSYYFKIITFGCLIPYFTLLEVDENLAKKRIEQNNYKILPKRITILK